MTNLPSIDVLTATRQSLHRVAEHLLAAAHKRATGQITLVPADNGVATPPLPDGSVVAIEGTDVVVRGPNQVRRAPLTTLAETAATVGIEAGFPWTKHRPGTEFEPDAELAVDPAAAAALACWFAVGAEALTTLVAELSAERPSAPQIFPEHFDLGVTAGAVNYGFSPGDDAIRRRTSTSGRTRSRPATPSGTRRSAPTAPGERSPHRRRRSTSSMRGAPSSACDASAPLCYRATVLMPGVWSFLVNSTNAASSSM